MASIDNPPKRPRETYPNGMSFAQANDWLNENILLPPIYILETRILRDWIEHQKAALYSEYGQESDFGLPTEQKFMSESASKDYKLQAKCYRINTGNLNWVDFRDPTQHSHNIPPSLKRKQSWHKDTPNPRRRVESTIAGGSLDNGTLLGGRLTPINLASGYLIGDSDKNEIKDARVENRGPEAGRSEEGESKSEGMLEKGNLEEIHLRRGELHRADCDNSNLRDLAANLPLNRGEEGRAGRGLGCKVRGGRHRRRRGKGSQKRASQRWINKQLPNKRQSMA